MQRKRPIGKPDISLDSIAKQFASQGTIHLDLWLTDLRGALKHATMEVSEVDETFVSQGAPKLDGSSIPGFTEIFESDLVLKPDWGTLAPLPWFPHTSRVFTDVYVGASGSRLERDPRYIAQNAERYLKSAGYTDSTWGPEPEFFVFEEAHYNCSTDSAYYHVSSKEAPWSQHGKSYVLRPKSSYYPSPPQDSLMLYRTKVVEVLVQNFAMRLEAQHHEVATAGQCEIDFRYGGLTETADRLQTVKYVAKNVASEMGLIATFMPKPLFGDNGSGMHTHQTIWSSGRNLFYDPSDSYAELSQFGRYYIGGLLEHSRALAAIVSPTTNSYRRLVPGFEAPVYAAWGKRNRSAAVRIPTYHKGVASAKRAEYRPADPSCNPYLAFAAMLMAGLDGVKKKIDPGDPVDENIYHLDSKRRRELGIRELPASLKEAVDALASDSAFLKPVFPQSLLDAYIELKKRECIEESLRPTPFEFVQYFDA
ncbi:MAG: type I glutamate--ammonia ligase [Thermoprotei archaeon]